MGWLASEELASLALLDELALVVKATRSVPREAGSEIPRLLIQSFGPGLGKSLEALRDFLAARELQPA